MPSLQRRSGFTLTELLVSIAVVAILMALLLPAVQAARERARVSQCKNNLRQFGLALHNYHDAYAVLPPGCVGNPNDPANLQGWGWGVMIFPFLEQKPLFQTLDPVRNSLPDVLVNAELQPKLLISVPLFRCPSDIGYPLQSDQRTFSGFVLRPTATTATIEMSASHKHIAYACFIPPPSPTPSPAPSLPPPGTWGVQTATSNYVGSFGNLWKTDPNLWTTADYVGNGAFGSNSSVRTKDVRDGTSCTFAIGERGWRSFASVWAGTDAWNRCEREGIPMILGTAHYRLNADPHPYNLSCDPGGAAGFGSEHSGGANFLMLDGSVRTIANDINYNQHSEPALMSVFGRLARRDDGRPLGEF